jgi:probable rRNA maturation factor
VTKVSFFYVDRVLRIKRKRLIRRFVSDIFSMEGKQLHHISYIFCSDNYLLEINKKYLAHDYYTDIITFDLSEGEGIIGEVYVSLDRIVENALAMQVRQEQESLRVIFHGALHLCGYRDKIKSEITIMRAKEDHYLRLFDEKIDGSIS